MTDKEFIEIDDPGLGQTTVATAQIDRQAAAGPAQRDDRLRTGRLAGMGMWTAIFALSWPVLVESFLNAMVGLVDTMMAAGISESAADAIGVASYFAWFCSLLGAALGVGATTLVSRSVGKGRFAVANAAVGQCYFIAICAGVAGGALMYATAPWIATLVALSGEAHGYFVTYLRVLSLGVPAMTIMGGATAALRGAGDSVTPMVTMIIVNIFNTFLTFALSGVDLAIGGADADGNITRRVLVHNPWDLDLGVKGIAIGTLVSSLVGAAIITAWLIRGVGSVRLRSRRVKPHWHTTRRLLRLGMPNLFEMGGMWMGNLLVITMVGWLAGHGLYGAHVVAVRIESFSFLPGFAMSLAAATLTGQYLGARRADLAAKAIRRCALIAGLFMGGLGVLFVVTPGAIVGLFSQQPTHLALSPGLLTIAGFIQAPFALAIVFRGALRGAGDTTATTVITWVTTYAVRIPLAWLCSGVEIPLPRGGVIPNPAPLQRLWSVEPLVGLWIGLCGEIIIRFLLFGGWFMRGTWKTRKV